MSNQTPKPQQYLTVQMAAERVSLSQKTIRRLIDRGELPVHRLGRSLRISATDLDVFCKTRRFA